VADPQETPESLTAVDRADAGARRTIHRPPDENSVKAYVRPSPVLVTYEPTAAQLVTVAHDTAENSPFGIVIVAGMA
jgi:hypothetical protein